MAASLGVLLLLLLPALGAPRRAAPAASLYHNYLEKFAAGRLAVQGGSASEGITLAVNATELWHSGQWVEVAVAGVPQPQPTDMLALYAPADAFVHGAAPVKYENLTAAPGYLDRGAGRLRWAVPAASALPAGGRRLLRLPSRCSCASEPRGSFLRAGAPHLLLSHPAFPLHF